MGATMQWSGSALSAGLLAGNQAGVQGWFWLLLAFILIFFLAFLLIYSAGQSSKSPYLEHLGHAGGDTTHAGAPEHAAHDHTRAQELSFGVDATADDLEIVEGIGPKIAGLLREAGISTFSQLAVTEVDVLKSLLKSANLRISDPTTWPDQARLASEGKWQELEQLQSQLKGGRKA